MKTFEELKEEFINKGFEINEDTFIYETVSYNTININGRVIQQPVKKSFKMIYVGEGEMYDKNNPDNKSIFWQFDVIGENNEPVVTICIDCFEDLNTLLR